MFTTKHTEILPGVFVGEEHFGRKADSLPTDMSHQQRALAHAKQSAAGSYLTELRKSEKKPTKPI